MRDRFATLVRRLALLLVFALVLLVTLPALAQGIPVISAGNPNPSQLLGYLVLFYLLDSAVLRALSADNTTLPFAPSPTVLVWINGIGSAALAVCSAIFGGEPWISAVGAGVLNFLVAHTHVGAAAGALKRAAVAKPVAGGVAGGSS